MQVCTSLQTDNHASTRPLSFLQAGCPSCHPTNSIKALKGTSGTVLTSLSVCIFVGLITFQLFQLSLNRCIYFYCIGLFYHCISCIGYCVYQSSHWLLYEIKPFSHYFYACPFDRHYVFGLSVCLCVWVQCVLVWPREGIPSSLPSASIFVFYFNLKLNLLLDCCLDAFSLY